MKPPPCPMISGHREACRRRPARGFSLVEMAVVLVIVGLLLGSVMVPLSVHVEQRQYNETQQQINDVREALYGFAMVNGRLPRPATTAIDGVENPAPCANDAACTGFIPWTTLGVKKTDAWNKIIRYSVTPAYPNAAFTLTTSGNKRVQTRDAAGNASFLIGSAGGCFPCAPAVVFSHGRNNWGTREDGTPLADSSATNLDEDVNAATPTTNNFFARLPSTNPAGGGEFDDILVWISPFILINRMVSAGRLP